METIHVERLGMSDDDLNAWITSVNQQLRLIFVFQGVVFKYIRNDQEHEPTNSNGELSPPVT